ncbi:hypothetical protein B0H11DRAFT_1354959 [Mycena galericulata]|nr:hypothetical protein B0H11DRAFT_1354959 [Mycena galericulata]
MGSASTELGRSSYCARCYGCSTGRATMSVLASCTAFTGTLTRVLPVRRLICSNGGKLRRKITRYSMCISSTTHGELDDPVASKARHIRCIDRCIGNAGPCTDWCVSGELETHSAVLANEDETRCGIPFRVGLEDTLSTVKMHHRAAARLLISTSGCYVHIERKREERGVQAKLDRQQRT